jgi:hypothetical protein
VPRLIAMGADMSRVHIVRSVNDDGERRWFDPAKDFPALAQAAARLPELRLMIVDPIVSAVAGDSHKNSETRRGLQPLVEFAERARCALRGVTHFPKASSGRDPIERVVGSIAFAAVARIIMATAKLPDDKGGRRVLVRVKNNLGPDGRGFHYQLRQVELEGDCRGIIASRVEWGPPIDGSAREILANAEQEPRTEVRLEGSEAAEWLRESIKDAGGEMDRQEVMAAAKAAGFSERTIDRVRSDAGVTTQPSGFGASKRSTWRIAENPIPPQSRQSRHSQKVGGHGGNGANPVEDERGEVF